MNEYPVPVLALRPGSMPVPVLRPVPMPVPVLRPGSIAVKQRGFAGVEGQKRGEGRVG
ncbi:hypothetical protein [Streptosporangium roseum]|uniref:hypothetical protein n=1 Tax=Streptosporangium roseum TaxID=2001 RepID=UPI00332C8041